MLGVLDAGQLDEQPVVAEALDGGFGHAEAVDAPRDGADQTFHLLFGRGLSFNASLVDELGAAREVEPEPEAEDVFGAALADARDAVVRHEERSSSDANDDDDGEE